MTASRLTVVRDGLALPEPEAGETIITTNDLKAWLRSGRMVGQLLRWRDVRLLTDSVETLGRPLPAGIAMRLMARDACYAFDAEGGKRFLSASVLAGWTLRTLVEPFARRPFLRDVAREVTALEQSTASGPWPTAPLQRDKRPVYVRGDVSFGLRAGGSVAHTAGVVNHLKDVLGRDPIVVTTDRIPMLRAGIERHQIPFDDRFWGFRELPGLVMNGTLAKTVARAVAAQPLAFLYQRYTLNGYAALSLARAHRIPLITEYNGSEVWVARHWGTPLKYEDLSRRIERLNLRAAHLVSVVSRPLADEVAAAGVDRHRILVNPNGVDTETYRPDVNATDVRTRYGLGGKTVIGFIGTFGPWHGADVLAEAFARLLARQADLRNHVRLLWIGDGVGLPRVRGIVSRGGVQDACVFAGLVPQESGPRYLAACDVFVSPHVPNPDGTPFFGSPTKLFEYMAMGRAIVASALDQIGEVLEDGRTALLVQPGDVDALSGRLARVVGDRALRERLGVEARKAAVERHSWRDHTQRTIDALARVLERGEASLRDAAVAVNHAS